MNVPDKRWETEGFKPNEGQRKVWCTSINTWVIILRDECIISGSGDRISLNENHEERSSFSHKNPILKFEQLQNIVVLTGEKY